MVHMRDILQEFLTVQDTVLNEGLEYIKRTCVDCIRSNLQILALQLQTKTEAKETNSGQSETTTDSAEPAPEIAGESSCPEVVHGSSTRRVPPCRVLYVATA